jgi:hypothetical protein
MNCDELADRMPAVARGAASWSPAEAEHLGTCADCRAEWAVVAAGAAVAQGVSLDADAMAARVLQRLRTEPTARPHRPLRWLIGVAAVAAALALFVLPARAPRRPAPLAPTALTIDVPGLDAVDAADLQLILDAVDTPWTETSTADAPSLDDLNDQELARMARAWES